MAQVIHFIVIFFIVHQTCWCMLSLGWKKLKKTLKTVFFNETKWVFSFKKTLKKTKKLPSVNLLLTQLFHPSHIRLTSINFFHA
jgi:hypothetical protein